jgi:hypothetical protein
LYRCGLGLRLTTTEDKGSIFHGPNTQPAENPTQLNSEKYAGCSSAEHNTTHSNKTHHSMQHNAAQYSTRQDSTLGLDLLEVLRDIEKVLGKATLKKLTCTRSDRDNTLVEHT